MAILLVLWVEILDIPGTYKSREGQGISLHLEVRRRDSSMLNICYLRLINAPIVLRSPERPQFLRISFLVE